MYLCNLDKPAKQKEVELNPRVASNGDFCYTNLGPWETPLAATANKTACAGYLLLNLSMFFFFYLTTPTAQSLICIASSYFTSRCLVRTR